MSSAAVFDFDDFRGRHYAAFAAAFCRGRLELPAACSDAEAIRAGLEVRLRLHKFKRSSELPRVRRALGMLKGLRPKSLLDVGSGRGVFLWPLLEQFPELEVTAIDTSVVRAHDLDAVARGGVARLSARRMDVRRLEFPERTFDAVTALEVLEHVTGVEPAARELIRVTRRSVVVSVPSQEDDNPDHVRLFSRATLRDLLAEAGAKRVSIEFVLNHMLAIARV
jgi:ubiquinone/menaquinone biosynthesis C-methylase UbiE